MILHQYTEEDYTVDPESVSVALRVRLGDFLKVRRTDVQDRGTVKSISLDGKVQIMTESGVSIFQRDQIYLLTCIAGHGRCTSIGPHGDKSWFSFH